MKIKLLLLFIALGSQGLYCQETIDKRETVFDSVVFLSDTIYDSIPYLTRLCDELPLKKQKIKVNGCELYVETEGEGIPIVLINGGPGGTHHYFHPWFSSLKESHHIIYYDQRGTGQSDFISGDNGYSFTQAMEDLEGLRKTLDISQWIVCGYSYGGLLAQYYTASYPEQVSGLVLVSALPGFKSEKFKSLQQKYITQVERDKLKAITERAIENKKNGNLNFSAFLYNMALNGDWKRQSFYKPTREQMIRSALYEWVNDKKFNKVMSASSKRYNFKGLFKNCPIPVLMMEGKHDLTWGSKKAAIFKDEFPIAEYVFFEGSGHSIFKDEPEQFMKVVAEFSSGLPTVDKSNVVAWKKEAKSYLIPIE
nr:alpha/beta hydrolase [uncultured Allomuricauda sp.]